jgi:hypothetical protein
MYLPKILWPINQSCSRAEDFIKQNALNNKKGVVGRRGNIIPIVPKPRDRTPTIISMYFKSFFFIGSHHPKIM